LPSTHRSSDVALPIQPRFGAFLPRHRLIALIVATALFMENLDSAVIATALPAIAADLGASPVHLSLAITSYLFALAVFIPASGWIADRYGTSTVFRAGIVVFTLGSILCGLSSSLLGFVLARALQGLGGAMMTPVGRLVLVRSVPKAGLVNAMAWFTTPALIGPMIGPPLGGFIATYLSWPWIFWINVPIGLMGIVLVTLFVPNHRQASMPRFDASGFVLTAVGLVGVVGAFEAIGRDVLPPMVVALLGLAGILVLTFYVRRARHATSPILDLRLLSIPTFRTAVVGGFVFRVAIGAMPVLLPLMLQLGFGLDPFRSGLLTFAAAAGALLMKTTAAAILRRIGFKRVLIGNGLLAAVSLAMISLFDPTTPHLVIVAVLLVGGFFRSLQFTSINTLAYADVPEEATSRATSFASCGQQLSLSVGAGTGALLLHLIAAGPAGAAPTPADFSLAFLAIAGIAASAGLVFARLPADAGAEVSGHRPVVRETSS
jgi:EmrB/QacA subfamily drug resistance transporter